MARSYQDSHVARFTSMTAVALTYPAMSAGTVSAMKPQRFHQLATAVLGLNALIVLTGAGVRLTESGLGCADWPNCEEGELAPTELDLLAWIEFGNRLLSGVVGLACVAALVGAWRLRPRSRDLTLLASGLVVGAAAQIVLGAFIIALDLDPIAVGGHFLISTAMLMAATLLWTKAMPEPADRPAWWHRFDLRATEISDQQSHNQGLRRHGWALLAMATVVVTAGVVVTGTGPNSGDSRATRLPFDFDAVARVHGVTVWLFLATLVGLAIRLHRNGEAPAVPLRLARLVRWLLVLSLAQGAVGYGQYLAGVPPALVELHILGAVSVWILTVVVWTGCRQPSPSAAGTRLRDVEGGVVERVKPVKGLLN